MFNIKRIVKQFSKWLYYFYISMHNVVPHSYHHLVFVGVFCFLCFVLAILIGVWYYLILDLIYISQVTNDVEHLLMSLVTIYISLVNVCLKLFKYCVF